MMIIIYRNFFTSSFVRTSWWSLHTATFPLPPFLELHDDHYMPQLFHFLLCYNFMIIITYRNFCTSSFVITSWWSLHTATFALPLLLYLHDDHYIPQLFHFLLCYNFMMIITYRNFSTSSFVITSWCLLHTVTYPLFCWLYLHEDHYILHFFTTSSHVLTFWRCIDTATFSIFLCHNFIMNIIYRIFFIFTYVITSWRLIYTAFFPLPAML